MKVTVIDCSVSGHRETYYKQFAQTWAGMGYETSLIAPDGKGVQETVAFQPVSALPLLPLPAGKTRRLQRPLAESNQRFVCIHGSCSFLYLSRHAGKGFPCTQGKPPDFRFSLRLCLILPQIRDGLVQTPPHRAQPVLAHALLCQRRIMRPQRRKNVRML